MNVDTARERLVEQLVGQPAGHRADGARSRVLLALAGPPGSGKSTVAASLFEFAQGRGIPTVIVPMDGWHLAHSVLQERGLVGVKGAPQTFDAEGFVATVERVRRQQPGEASVWVPEFRREIEDPVAGAIEVRPEHRLVIVEGNYVLLDEEPWRRIHALCDTRWMLTPDTDTRQGRLIARHTQFGRTVEDAAAHALGSDEANALLVQEHSLTSDVLSVDPG